MYIYICVPLRLYVYYVWCFCCERLGLVRGKARENEFQFGALEVFLWLRTLRMALKKKSGATVSFRFPSLGPCVDGREFQFALGVSMVEMLTEAHR